MNKNIGIWGRDRQRFLKNNYPKVYEKMRKDGTLIPHLLEIDHSAREMFTDMTDKMIAAAPEITEELKEKNMMRWVGLCRNIQETAREIVYREMIYQ